MAALVEKFPVFPTRMSEQIMKSRLKVAEKGHILLKRKSDVLQRKFREICQEIIEIKKMLGEVLRKAAYLLAEARYLTGDINNDILNRVTKARVKVGKAFENIAGVEIMKFECFEAGDDEFGLTGLARGGERLQKLKRVNAIAIDTLVQLATLQNAFKTLDAIIQSTNRRVNALEHRYIPKVKNTLKYIVDSLDESERQDFYRMKMIKKKKKQEQNEKLALRNKTQEDVLEDEYPQLDSFQ